MNDVEKEEKKALVKDALFKLRKRGVRFEQIAVQLGLSNSTIEKWFSGERLPKDHTLQHMEYVWKIKILKKDSYAQSHQA